MSKIPGSISTHRIVSVNCRKRPHVEWIDDCLNSIRNDLTDVDMQWPKDSEVKFHVIVAVERP